MAKQPATTSKVSAREAFAANLRHYRLAKGFSQEALAEIVGLHRTYVGSVERGERNISIDNIERFALALQLPITDLLKPPHGGRT
jgi:transcriptional regulator with XRE-family HTH domain